MLALFNSQLPTGHTGCLEIFCSLKVPMDLFPVSPDFPLRFGQSCTLPFVKPSKCGFLGLDVLLTDSTCGGNVVHKAVMITLRDHFERGLFNNESVAIDLSSVTHFDASRRCWLLYCGHLEQLAIACPNLQHLNLKDVKHCLERFTCNC